MRVSLVIRVERPCIPYYVVGIPLENLCRLVWYIYLYLSICMTVGVRVDPKIRFMVRPSSWMETPMFNEWFEKLSTTSA